MATPCLSMEVLVLQLPLLEPLLLLLPCMEREGNLLLLGLLPPLLTCVGWGGSCGAIA